MDTEKWGPMKGGHPMAQRDVSASGGVQCLGAAPEAGRGQEAPPQSGRWGARTLGPQISSPGAVMTLICCLMLPPFCLHSSPKRLMQLCPPRCACPSPGDLGHCSQGKGGDLLLSFPSSFSFLPQVCVMFVFWVCPRHVEVLRPQQGPELLQ